MSVIPIDPREIALESDLLPEDSTASIRIRARPSWRSGKLLRLHDEDIGTYARVFLGRLRASCCWRSVAIKLQRDEVASDFAYDHQIVSAKFDEELANHLELQRSRPGRNSLRTEPNPTVRLLLRPSHLQKKDSASSPSVEVLPPCLFCLRARHALRLLGRDGEPLQQGPPSGSQRYLESQQETGYGRRYYSDHLDEVVRSTVGRDPSACASCQFRGGPDADPCLDYVKYVNLFENRVLFFEPLDVSLHDALRWWKGERRPLAVHSRRTLFAIEARLRRLRPRGSPGSPDEANLHSILDLRLRIDVFRQILRGVEALHARGIPHLDINPENICLKVRAGRVQARLIDLGMAANPKFTAKEQHEKRLWPRRADFAAEECQRLSIFLSRQLFVRIAPHQLASRVPVCRGDQLLYESPEGLPNGMPLEVVSCVQQGACIPGFGAFPFLCEVDGLQGSGATPAGLELRIIPQRGPAADVFSLGMVLASLVLHETSGDELRRELGKIEESLFSHWQSVGTDREPIPGRILVHRVLSRPDEHTRWFRERLEALRIYGAVRPLAEELLGIALRALVRSNHHHPYLTDRGGDARLALQRFAADVRAVRRSLDGDLVATRYRAALAGRREALHQLAARCGIEIASLLPEPMSDARNDLPSDPSPLQDALRMMAADPERSEAESRQFANSPLSKSRIVPFVHDLDLILDPATPKRFANLRSLLIFLEWSHQPQCSAGRLQQLYTYWKPVPDDSGRAIGSWREHDRELARQLASALEAIELVERALAIYDQRIGRATKKSWWRALGWRRITISTEDFRMLGQGRDSIELLEASRSDSDRHAQTLRDRFVVDLERWRRAGGKWSETWMGELERRATEFWTIRLAESQDLWTRSRATLITSLRSFFEVLNGAAATVVERSEDIVLTLSKANADRLQAHRAVLPADLFLPPVLGPAFDAEADFASRRLAILQGTELGRSGGNSNGLHFARIVSTIQSPPDFGSDAGVQGNPTQECVPPVLESKLTSTPLPLVDAGI
jgi:serine/threonine protein kinase